MLPSYTAFITLCLALALVGCGSDPADSEFPAVFPSPAAAKPTAYHLPAQAGPEALAAFALSHNPKLQAMKFRALRLAQKAPQVASLPDPMASLSLGSLPETAAGRVEAMAGVSQKVPFPGKRQAESASARQEALAAAAEAQAYALQLTEQVRLAWWDYHLAHATIRISGESKDLLQLVEKTVSGRVAANQGTQADQLRIAARITEIDRTILQARGLSQTAAARLNSLLNRPPAASLPAPSARAIPKTGQLDSLLARAQKSHPEVAAAANRTAASRSRVERARLEKFPDVTFGLQGAAVDSGGLAKSANGDDQVFGTVGVNIPLWQEPRRAMIREAQAGLAETEALLGSTRADLRYRVQEAWFRAQTARGVLDLLESRLLPDARQAFQLSLTSYSAGTGGFTELTDTWVLSLAYELQLAQTRAQLGKAVATLQAATGN